MARGLPCTVLRQTLMFGCFDRRRLGWLARFMRKASVFPVPDRGASLRQPLYGGDFCNAIIACLDAQFADGRFDISGLEQITCLDIIRQIKEVVGSRTVAARIPFRTFWWLLRTNAVFDADPPFTTRQLEALVIPESFPVTNGPGIFRSVPTSLRTTREQTFRDPTYPKIVLDY